jgi:hypothetical protein
MIWRPCSFALRGGRRPSHIAPWRPTIYENAFACCLLLALAVPTRAQVVQSDVVERLAVSGSIRGGYWSSNRELSDQRNFTPGSVWLKMAPELGNGFSGRAEGWIADQRPLSGQAPEGELREGLLSWRGEDTELSLGRRIVVWGRADKINPTDVIGSRDYTLLFADDDDQRRGSTVAKASRAMGNYTVSAFWLPEFRPNIIPIPQEAGLTVIQQGDKFDPAQFAVRLDHVAQGIDWALSYFDGLDRDDDARIAGLSDSGILVETRHHRTKVFGADYAVNLGQFGLRGEAAYHRPAAPTADDIFDKGAYVAAVFGVDRNFFGSLNVNVQYILHYTIDAANFSGLSDPAVLATARKAALLNNQLIRNQQGASLRVAYTGINDTLSLELSAVGYATDGSVFVRPKVSYAISDFTKVVAGMDLFFGTADSFFGWQRKNRVSYVELRYGF